MNNVELEEILQMYPVTVCCADELPASIKNRPRTFVVNTDPCSKSGSHWTVFHFPDKGPCEFFDSAGNLPAFYQPRFEFVLVVNGSHYLYTPDRIQPTDSVTCGLYCVYFVQQRYGNVSFKNIMKGFSTMHLMDNDRRVLRKTIRD
jgi:hypothetical protein